MARKIKLKVSPRLLKKRARRSSFNGKKHCRFCSNDQAVKALDFKNAYLLRSFITERGKILPSRISGTCALHQRGLAQEIKRARIMALLPYTSAQV